MAATNLRANQQAIGDYNEFLSAGRHNLEESFRSTLADSCKPVEPLHFITKGRLSIHGCLMWTMLKLGRIALSCTSA